jgi:hypothetical protein
MSSLGERREKAREFLAKIVNHGPTPLPAEEIKFTHLDDKRVLVEWNIGRRLTWEQVAVLTYHRGNRIIADRNGWVFGFEGDAWDYLDYCSDRLEGKNHE